MDSPICGFTLGSAFAVLEGLLYISRSSAGGGPIVVLSRAFSTSLMHASATALIGASLERMRFSRGLGRLTSVPLGWLAAMTRHIRFDTVVNGGQGLPTAGLAIVLGQNGLGLVVAFIVWGLSHERRWLRETLGLNVAVSTGEAAVVQ